MRPLLTDAMVYASATTDWISAVSGAALGILAFIVTVWQWRANGFRPAVSALIETQATAIEVRILNRGRGAGVIHHVVVVDNQLIEVHALFDGFEDEKFEPTALPAFAAMKLILKAPPDVKFPTNARVKVEWAWHHKIVTPSPVAVGLYGLKPVLPPAG